MTNSEAKPLTRDDFIKARNLLTAAGSLAPSVTYITLPEVKSAYDASGTDLPFINWLAECLLANERPWLK